MFYRLDPRTSSSKFYTEPRSGISLPYRTVREMRKLYPNGNFIIVGEIGGIARPPNGGDALLTDDGREISLSPRGSFKPPFEWVWGYVSVGEDVFAAVIGSVLRIFMLHGIPL